MYFKLHPLNISKCHLMVFHHEIQVQDQVSPKILFITINLNKTRIRYLTLLFTSILVIKPNNLFPFKSDNKTHFLSLKWKDILSAYRETADLKPISFLGLAYIDGYLRASVRKIKSKRHGLHINVSDKYVFLKS